MTDLPQAAVDAGRAAANTALMTRNQSSPDFAEKLAVDVLEAARPAMAADERARLRHILLANPVILVDPVAIARPLENHDD
jgi:hypothetical protein